MGFGFVSTQCPEGKYNDKGELGEIASLWGAEEEPAEHGKPCEERLLGRQEPSQMWGNLK